MRQPLYMLLVIGVSPFTQQTRLLDDCCLSRSRSRARHLRDPRTVLSLGPVGPAELLVAPVGSARPAPGIRQRRLGHGPGANSSTPSITALVRRDLQQTGRSNAAFATCMPP